MAVRAQSTASGAQRPAGAYALGNRLARGPRQGVGRGLARHGETDFYGAVWRVSTVGGPKRDENENY